MSLEKARFVLSKYVQAKKEHKDMYAELISMAVGEFGLPQDIVKNINVADWIDGYLAANGVYGDHK